MRGALPVVVGERVVQGGVINDVLGGGWEGMGMGDGSGSIPALDPPVMDSDTWCPSLPAAMIAAALVAYASWFGDAAVHFIRRMLRIDF